MDLEEEARKAKEDAKQDQTEADERVILAEEAETKVKESEEARKRAQDTDSSTSFF